MRPFVAAVLVLSLLASPVLAAAPKAPTTSLAGVPSGRYDIDASHTNVVFSLSHLGFSNYIGRFNKVEGMLMFDAANPEKSTTKISVDIASIDTNNDGLEEKLRSDKVFDAAKFPTASFTSTKLEKLSDSKGKLHGNLTIRGTTRPVIMDLTFNGTGINPFAKGQVLGFSATTKIKRSDFGIDAYLPSVGDEVTLTLETEFLQKKD